MIGSNGNYNSNNFRNNQGRAKISNNVRSNSYVSNNANRNNNPRNLKGKDNNQKGNLYGNICNTMQKRFNMALYKGNQNLNNKEKMVNVEYSSKKKNNSNSNSNGNNMNFNKSSQNSAKRVPGNRFNVIESKSSLNKNKQDRVQYNRNFNKSGNSNNNNNLGRKTVLQEYKDTNKISSKASEINGEQEAFPMSAFIFITIAVIFVVGLIVIVTNNETVEKKIVSIKKEVQDNRDTDLYDEGLNLEPSLDAQQQDLEENVSEEILDEGSRGTEIQQSSEVQQDITQNNQTNENVPSTTTKPSTTNNTNNNANTNNNTTNNTNTNSNSNNNGANNNATPVEEEEEEEEEEIIEEEMVYIPLNVKYRLYHCTGDYGTVAASGFTEYTKKTEKSGTGIRVPKSDLNGIWADVRGTTVVDYIGYKNGVKTSVVALTLQDNDNMTSKTIYALKDTQVKLGGKYIEEGSSVLTIVEMITAKRDVTLIKFIGTIMLL